MIVQLTDTMAVIRDYLRCARWSELGGHGLFHNHFVYDARICGAVNCLLPLAHEQGVGLYHVSIVLCLCCCLADVRIWFDHLPSVICVYGRKTKINTPRDTNRKRKSKKQNTKRKWKEMICKAQQDKKDEAKNKRKNQLAKFIYKQINELINK